MAGRFQGKVVIVTGSSGGLGSSAAAMFAAGGAKVVLTSRSIARLEKAVQGCLEAGATQEDILTVAADVTVFDDLKNLVEKTMEHFSRVDILVNNAGLMLTGGIMQATVDDLDNMLTTNLKSAFILTQLCLPHLIASHGCIVNVSSLAGYAPAPTFLAYSMSKAALNQMTKSIALELAQKGVRVNAVNPSAVLTELLTKPRGPIGGDDPAKIEAFMKKVCTTHPPGRIGQAHEVSDVIGFLASDQSSYMTGQCLPVDGGRHATIWGCMPQPQPPSQS
ncbi:hypothetical protein CAPTEDRAFT_219507 [Capitella teleta]|uniref:Ketoreductase domain-containing protein n=1 Tax=Capitella teleta TaxID=283909 RepID=X2APN6_CAPTE|nr:hypothetical protein CAPTEDRAFT_219507 [Capitella teleta]|eukprot:ELU10170.1 hypothetical protein CAPTEDRAFT_219507 [Capitella teleta]